MAIKTTYDPKSCPHVNCKTPGRTHGHIYDSKDCPLDILPHLNDKDGIHGDFNIVDTVCSLMFISMVILIIRIIHEVSLVAHSL